MFRKKVNPNDPNADLDNALFNPWAGMLQGRKSNDPDDPSALPIGWDRLSQASAERVGLALVESDPDLGGLAVLGPWRRLRARHLLREHKGESGAIAEALRPYYLSDPVERAKWRKAEAEIAAVGPFLLPNALRKLKASGDMLCSLRARRDELNVQIERLERRLGLATTDGAGARQ